MNAKHGGLIIIDLFIVYPQESAEILQWLDILVDEPNKQFRTTNFLLENNQKDNSYNEIEVQSEKGIDGEKWGQIKSQLEKQYHDYVSKPCLVWSSNI